ncbi:proline/serine-rich coiled-coil protein 1 isoform X2 [Protopterus annectens]|uniref:proline/serine-rich coiled-coil protein 1 isoform X2 n=1 Tax=Protopterus annectens TaxID=7888 RepID=UPI001CFBA843|nr:proline/serine-rich coiled-coil protein 1 isoform X2 [Protopterus annectens]
MDLAAEGDLTFIDDETFDFGLPSFSDSREEVEDNEKFISPIKQTEKLSALNIDLNISNTEPTNQQHGLNWSPLTAEKLEEIAKEANRLAEQLEQCALQEKENTDGQLSSLWVTCSSFNSEKDAAILRLLQEDSKSKKSPRSPRRETYIVKDSPVKALLPTVDLDNVSPLVSPKGTVPKTSTPFRSAEHSCKRQSKRSKLEYPVRDPKAQANRNSTPRRLSKPSPGSRPSSGKSRTPNNKPLSTPLGRKETTPTVVSPNNKPLSTPLGRKETTPTVVSPNYKPLSTPLGRKETTPTVVSPNNKPLSTPLGRKETTPTVVSSKSPSTRQQSCSSVAAAGCPAGKPVTTVNAKKMVSPRSNADRVRTTGIPKPISRLPVASSIPRPVTGISRSISGNINPLQAQAKPVARGKGVCRPAAMTNVPKASKALVTQSKLQPPKKVTLPGALRCLTADRDDGSGRKPAFYRVKQNKDKAARSYSGYTVPGVCSRPEVMNYLYPVKSSSPAQKVQKTINTNMLRL